MRVQVVLIEGNAHLRSQLSEVVERMGLHVSATYETASAVTLKEISRLAPAAVIFPIRIAHAHQWRLVKTLQTLPQRPVLVALSQVNVPSMQELAMAAGVDHIVDPLDVDSFLATLDNLSQSVSGKHRQHVA